MADFGTQRLNMVESQVRPSDVTDRHLMRVLQTVPRELFVPAASRSVAYADEDVAVSRAEAGRAARHLLAPRTLAKLIQAADVKPADRVLDVGCGTGYSTAVLAGLAATVVGLEVEPALASSARENLAAVEAGSASVREGPLNAGWPAGAPYDVIILNGTVPSVPAGLLAQLAEGGRLIAILSGGDAQRSGGRSSGAGLGIARSHVERAGSIGVRDLFDAGAPRLPGFDVITGFAF